ncbi:ABC transporter permease [Clostridium sp. Marseille-P299]|uniref:ABC transporter permease n=1 Tax=Clostridium sp. Marseille-P299 TaxID=1805477 RepID=UPI00082C1AFD|nr:ABC transporter permease subunit [Clostridium sp. Marseille-P299]
MSTLKKYKNRILAILLWILIWQGFSMYLDNEILLASPLNVLKALYTLLHSKVFYFSIFHSLVKISVGFLLAVVFGILLALFSSMNSFIKEMISIMIRLMKSIPVASFVILTLLWVRSQNLSIIISFLMVLPIIYLNVLHGIQQTDVKLLEMAKVFNMSFIRKVRYIYIPAVMPYFISASSASLGLCWKAGVAAEVIGLPRNSIGEQLYEAKLYLMTKELFAWTFVIVLISLVFERFVMAIIRRIGKLMTGASI